HVNDIRLFIVDLDLARFVTVTARHGEIRRGHDRAALVDRGGYFVVSYVSDLLGGVGGDCQERHRQYCRKCQAHFHFYAPVLEKNFRGEQDRSRRGPCFRYLAESAAARRGVGGIELRMVQRVNALATQLE